MHSDYYYLLSPSGYALSFMGSSSKLGCVPNSFPLSFPTADSAKVVADDYHRDCGVQLKIVHVKG